MGLRPGHCYATLKDRAYTRVAITVPKRNYIGTNPGLKTRQFNMGETVKDFTHILDLVTDDAMQIRDNAIEAVRIAINRFLNNKIGKENYFMKIRIYPYHILRENKQAQGAHADRIQKGMSHAFGKPIGRAVRVRKGEKLISVLVNEENIDIAKEALMRANAKMPCTVYVKIGTDVDSIGTRPRFIKEITVEEIAAQEAAAKEKAAAKEGKEVERKEAAPSAAAGAEKAAEKGAEKGAGKAAEPSAAGKAEAKKPEGKAEEKKK